MSAKEKAIELVNKYLAIQFGDFPTTEAKQCALIAVDEVLNAIEYLDYDSTYFWQQVKTEIGKL